MCDCEEVFTCLPSIVSWVRAHAALGGSGTNCVGKSRPPSQRQSSRHWVKAHSDPHHSQHLHTNTDNFVTYFRWTPEDNLIFHVLTVCLRPYRLQLGGKGVAQRKSRWVPESNGWCCAVGHWKPPLQHSKTTAGHCTNTGSCPQYTIYLCAEEAGSHTPGMCPADQCSWQISSSWDTALTHPAVTYPKICRFDKIGLTIQVTILHINSGI